MDLSIITGLPYWYVLLCVIAGILASMLLYFREKKNEFKPWLNRLLGVLRFFIVAMAAFLLLSPFIKITSRTAEKPIIVVAQDNSLSMVMGMDSGFYRNTYTARLNDMLASLKDDYDLRLFTFGEDVVPAGNTVFDSLTFGEKYTDMAAIADMMDVRFVNRNVGALLIAGDGIFNRGLNPRYHSAGIAYPVYTLALGDTAVRRDAYLKRVLYNKIAFQGNDFPVEAIVNATKLGGRVITVSLTEGSSLIDKRQFAADNDNFSKTLLFTVPAGEPGMHHYVLRVSAGDDEVSRDNNRYDLFIDVLKAKQKVLILYHAPHPDVSALKEAIGSNVNYEVSDMAAAKFSGPLNEYSLLILHQLPALSTNNHQLTDQVSSSGIPVLYILGRQSLFTELENMNAGLRLTRYERAGSNEALPHLNEAFNLFIPGEPLKEIIKQLPPLDVPFARYAMSNASGVLFYQKIGSIVSGDPLWLLNGEQQPKSGVITGTGLWRWRMKIWMETGEHKLFNELVNKTVQFLSLREDRRRFKVFANDNIPESSSVEFNAELYNESYEPYNDPDINLRINDEAGNTYNFLFNKSGNAYLLDAGNFPVGTYTYTATANTGDEVFTDAGGFTVAPVVAEQLSLRADHGLLRALAAESGGLMIEPGTLADFPEILKQRNDIKPLIHAERKFIEFIDIWWILACLIALLGVEWFFRKWSGSY